MKLPTKVQVAMKLAADRADEWSGSRKIAKKRTAEEQKKHEEYIWSTKSEKSKRDWYLAAFYAGGYER